MLRLTPTTITLTPGELQGLEHRRRFKSLLRRMSHVQIQEDSPEEDAPTETGDDGRILRVDGSTQDLTRASRRMDNIQVHEDSSAEETTPVNTADDGRGLRDEESTRGPLRVPSPSSERLNQHTSTSRHQDESDAGPSRLSSGNSGTSISACLQ